MRLLKFSILLMSNIFAADWQDWLANLKQDAIAEGISVKVFEQALADWQPRSKVIKLDRNQPEKRISFTSYKSTRANSARISYGRRAWRKYGDTISEISHQYQVDPCIVTAIWGIETSYGNYMGRFPVIASLATLAYDGRRADFFRKELLLALHIVNDGHVDPKKFVGEWAGGSGHPQFLPSSWVEYAQDYDGDGYKDIWNNLEDVFASIANYLKQNGWQYHDPIASVVRAGDLVPNGFKDLKSVDAWRNLGVTRLGNEGLPEVDGKAALVKLDGGPLLLAYPNFRVIMRYNHSIYYAGTVVYLADKICKRVSEFN